MTCVCVLLFIEYRRCSMCMIRMKEEGGAHEAF